MASGIEQRAATPAAAGRPALIIARNPCVHDSRILREAHTLSALGYRPQILGVVSEQVRDRHAISQGVPITRLSPTSPFSWVRSRLRGSRQRGVAAADGPSGRKEGAPISVAIRVHRWIRTLDYYRRGVGVVRELRPALIHCNDYNTMWIGVAARLMGGAIVVYDSHELWADRNQRPEPRWWLLACEFVFVRCAHRTITASPGYADVIARRYRVPPPGVIRNIPATGPSTEARTNGAAAGSPEQPSPGEAPLALYVGALTTGRGLEISIKAMARLDGARLRFVGPVDDRYRAELMELAQREGVADRFELAGAVPPEQLLETIGLADVGLALIQPVCLSYRMSLPNKLFEYVAAGVPVLGSDLPAIGRLISEHGIGLLAQPDQVTDVAAKLGEMLRPDRNMQLRLAVREAAAELRWDREARLLADNYAEAAASAVQRPPG